MAKTICKILGVVFVLVGICGFLAPTLLGAHLTPAHNLVHLVSGAIALYFGFAGSARTARVFCLIFGVVYLLLGVVGWLLGTGAEPMFKILCIKEIIRAAKERERDALADVTFVANEYVCFGIAGKRQLSRAKRKIVFENRRQVSPRPIQIETEKNGVVALINQQPKQMPGNNVFRLRATPG